MNCNDYQEWISAELDGELEAERAAVLDRHLERCATCRQVKEDYRMNRLLLHALSPKEVPAHAWKSILQRIEAGDLKADAPAPSLIPAPPAVRTLHSGVAVRSWRRAWRALRAAACLALVFLGSLVWLGWTDPELSADLLPSRPTESVNVGTLVHGHALFQAANPIADGPAWHYMAGEFDPEEYEIEWGTTTSSPSHGKVR